MPQDVRYADPAAFHPVMTIDEALAVALEPAPARSDYAAVE